MRFISGALIALALCACGKDDKKEEAKPEAAKPPVEAKKPADPAPPPTTAPPAATAVKLTCDEVVPPALRDKYLAGATADEKTSDQGVDCTYQKDSDFTIVGTVCPGWNDDLFQRTIQSGKEAMTGATDIAIGRGGYIGDQSGAKFVQFWDDNTQCYVTVAGSVAGIEALAKEIVGTLTPAAVGG
jgi:hypothetical protein